MFSALGSPEFPATFPFFFVCVAMTNATGDAQVGLQVVDAAEVVDPDPLSVLKVTATFPDRFAVVQVVAPFQNVTFPRAGEYRVQLSVDGTLLMERRILLLPAGKATPPQEEP